MIDRNRKDAQPHRRGLGEKLGGAEERKSVITMYCRGKTVFTKRISSNYSLSVLLKTP